MNRRISKRAGLVGLAFLMWTTSPCAALPIVVPSVEVLDGLYHYSYTVENYDSSEGIWDFNLDLPTTVMDVRGPSDDWFIWQGAPGDPGSGILGFVEWTYLLPGSGIPVGSERGMFSFVSALAPGPVSYTMLGDSVDSMGVYTGTTQGPAVAPVPEPSTLVMLGTGVAWTFVRRRRERRA